VFYSGGPNTLAYAEELRQLFAETWETNEVSVVPVGDERIIDVQITVGNKGQEVEARTLLDAFQSAGIKHKKFFSVDPDAGNDAVLWVGPKSPKDASPDQCGSPELNPQNRDRLTIVIGSLKLEEFAHSGRSDEPANETPSERT
jgi:hypothetical protein